MNAVKPLAMLSSGLLARKGTAIPAALGLQLDLMGQLSANPIPSRFDMRAPPPRQNQAASRPDGGDASSSAPPPHFNAGPRPDPSDGAKVSLRLDGDRYRRLRLAALHQRSSGQKILLEALDAYLGDVGATVMDGNCACLQSRPS
jgi:hypothetical protein